MCVDAYDREREHAEEPCRTQSVFISYTWRRHRGHAEGGSS
jgi:hypothetical protein